MDPGSSLSTANVARSLRGPLILMALVFAAAPAHAQMPEAETSEMAYVSAQARGPGKRGEAMHPFSSLQQALAAGARELRIEPGLYPEEQLALGGGGTVTLRRWDPHARDASAVTIRGAVTIDDATTVILDAGGEAFHFLGDLLLHDGILELRSTTLTMGTPEGTTHTLLVGKNSRLLGSNPCARNLIRFTGGDTTHVFIETTEARLHFDFPCIEIEKDETGVVTFDASGVPATTVPPDPPDRLDVLATPRFTLISAADSAGVRLRDGLDLLDVARNYTQRDGGLSMAGRSSSGAGALQPTTQILRTDDFAQDHGTFFATGGSVEVLGNFYLGRNQARDPSSALFSLAPEGTHTVAGVFSVAPDVNPNDRPDGAFNPLERNRYVLGGGRLVLLGNYRFEGTGDRFDDDVFLLQHQGLDGVVVFAGLKQQTVFQRQDEDAFFNDVILDGPHGIRLRNHGWQNDDGILSLRRGIIVPEQPSYSWVNLNADIEVDLAERNNAARDAGVVEGGSPESYVRGPVQRVVALGTKTERTTGGYLFPVGTRTASHDFCAEPNTFVDSFRPLILEFPDYLGISSVARVEYRSDLTPEDFEFPEGGLVVDAANPANPRGTLTLDVLGRQFWQLEFDRIPSFDPDVRVEAADLQNVFDIKSLRLIQWECDGTNPRLAGLYDLPGGVPFPILNEFIDGVPNVKQKGVDVNECQLFGIASNFLINPINLPSLSSAPVVRVQFIHNVPGVGNVDVYFDNQRILDDLSFQTATHFVTIPAGTHQIDFVAGADEDNAHPLWTSEQVLLPCSNYIVIALGSSSDVDVLVLDEVRLEARSPDRVEYLLVHGAPDAPALDLRLLDPLDTNNVLALITNNLAFGEFRGYAHLDPTGYHFQITNADNTVTFKNLRLDLHALGGETSLLLITRSRFDDSLTLLGFRTDGNPVSQLSVRTDEAEAVPEAFTLRGNYPNPFNPSTTLSFDLPETAQVRIELIDLLGRTVMTTPARLVEAGAARTLTVDASMLASGTYLYRIIAQTPTRTLTETGRMVLVR